MHLGRSTFPPQRRDDLPVNDCMVRVAIELGVGVDVGRLDDLEQVVEVSSQVRGTESRVLSPKQVTEVAITPPPASTGGVGAVKACGVTHPRQLGVGDRLKPVVRIAQQENLGMPTDPR